MADSDGQERTEDATSKRLQQAKDKGQVARSKELASVSVLVCGAISLMWFGDEVGKALLSIMSRFFSISREEIFDTNKLLEIVGGALVALVFPVLKILLMLFGFWLT
jgi:flagellar biosynthetic protein FlhB